MKVWQAHCVCPNGHILMVSTDECRDGESPAPILRYLKGYIDASISHGVGDPWCNICYAPATRWDYKMVVLPYATLGQAIPHLQDESEKDAELRVLYAEHRFQFQTRH